VSAEIPAAHLYEGYQWEAAVVREEWQDDALCTQTDPEIFFPDKSGSTVAAKTVCAACDVREQCLGYALENDERFGIWGGKSERERRKMNKAAAQ
jgi:WhiB family redox-sensing transcriptional regulator